MDPILESFIASPTLFVLGAIIALGLILFREYKLRFSNVPKLESDRFVDTGREHVALCSNEFKENVMDIKNSKEVILAIDALVFDVIQSLKVEGNTQVKLAALLAKLLSDTDLQAKFISAFAEYDQIIPELKDLTIEEGIELGSAVILALPKYFKK